MNPSTPINVICDNTYDHNHNQPIFIMLPVKANTHAKPLMTETRNHVRRVIKTLVKIFGSLPRPSRRLHARLEWIRGGDACSPLGLGLGAGECVSIRWIVSMHCFLSLMSGGYILGKRPGQSFLAADFLATDEGINGDGDGTVDVLCGAIF